MTLNDLQYISLAIAAVHWDTYSRWSVCCRSWWWIVGCQRKNEKTLNVTWVVSLH